IMKASSAIPFVCRPYEVRGVPYYDGALGDPIPIEKAFEMGCDKVVLLLTLPADTVRKPDKDRRLARGIRKQYPLSAAGLERRAQRYNESVALARRYAAQGKVLIVAPDNTCGVSTLKRNADNMRKLYEKGYGDGAKIVPFLSE
ncbi:MAG: patatin family protein, partial [Oscillospiraceae bacterium]|nr:patatin family protein [Oscillospiraceae bacterium]